MEKRVKSSKKNRRSKKRGNQGLLGEGNQQTTVIPQSIGWASRRLRVTLCYLANAIIVNNTLTYANRRYEPTFAYDVDPTLGSTSMPGFAEYTAIYRLYRVRSSRIKVTFANLEAAPVVVCLCPVNTDPGANTSNYANYFSSTLARTKTLGPLTGNSAGNLSHAISTNVIAGVRDLQQLDNYVGNSAGTAPTNNWYWFVGAESFTSFTTAGVAAQIKVFVEIEFFELLNPSV